MKRVAIEAVRWGGHSLMARHERRLMHHASQPYPPIFIIGAPRSGTSLLYELMITRFRFAYMSNAAHRFFKTPLAATRLFERQIATWRGDFTSQYGHIEGWGAPNEGGWIWQRWLRDSDWIDGNQFPDAHVRELRQLTSGFARLADAPFLNKNVMHSNRIRLMTKIWPEALFIEVRRETLDNARSILRAERAAGGPDMSGDGWWSVRPRLAADYAGQPDTVRSVAQVVGVARDIEEDIASVDSAKLLRIDYGDFCAAPRAAMAQVASFLERDGCTVAQRHEVPATFEMRPSRLLAPDDEAALARSLADLGGL
jgi:hypothetical protein